MGLPKEHRALFYNLGRYLTTSAEQLLCALTVKISYLQTEGSTHSSFQMYDGPDLLRILLTTKQH